MKGVNYKKLRRFDIGKIRAINPGYQTNKEVVDTSSFQSNAGYDMSKDTQAVRNAILPQALTSASGLGNAAMNFAQNYTTLASAATTNVNTAISKGLVDAAGKFTEKGAEWATKAGIQGADELFAVQDGPRDPSLDGLGPLSEGDADAGRSRRRF